MKLISMTDFVLKQNTSQPSARRLSQIIGYAEFLKQPLKLEMFVPCDENGNILKFPIDVYYKPDFGCQKYPQECYEEDLRKYEQAKEKVLFDVFHVTGSDNDLIELELYNENLWIDFYKESIIILTDSYKVECPIKNIEDLLEYNLTLTQNAIKQLGL